VLKVKGVGCRFKGNLGQDPSSLGGQAGSGVGGSLAARSCGGALAHLKVLDFGLWA